MKDNCNKNKNDFSIIAFYENRKPLKLAYVHRINKKLFDYLQSKGQLTAVNVYNRRCRYFIKQYNKFY